MPLVLATWKTKVVSILLPFKQYPGLSICWVCVISNTVNLVEWVSVHSCCASGRCFSSHHRCLIEMTLLIGTLIHTLPKSFKKSAGLRKTCFLSKKTTHLFFKKKQLLWIFQIYTDFCSFFKRNTKTPFWIIFTASCNISIFRITQ